MKKLFYNGDDLGAIYGSGKTSFKLWSPTADMVILRLYQDGEKAEAHRNLPMAATEHGVWSLSSEGNLNGIYYDYEIWHGGSSVSCADPYAKACGVNGKRSMVIDLELTNPLGWENDRAPLKESEDMIYELHVKEFSHNPNGGFRPEFRGKYPAFTEKNTTLSQDGIHPTGLSYLKVLGVNYLQLMPVYDYGSVDEAGDDSQFNWGYDPMNYNVPEGSYSTDPYHGEVRVRELKEMIQAIHNQGFRVIMDVVYNHTYSADSWLERSAPGYYYRKNKDGTLSNGSGCGNDIASERPMCSKYILDSVLYWTKEYHMDGFRFDLMGLLDTDLMNQIRKELDGVYGRGEKLIYGEPWSAGPSPMEGDKISALREHIHSLDSEVGVFCDGIRDAIKGHVFEEKVPGFVNGGDGLEDKILHCVTACCGREVEHPAKAPSQMITYASAHDNLTLWDKLVISMKEVPDFSRQDRQVERANRLAAAICYTCQGRMFMLSGEEFGRTKNGLENSYQADVKINRLDWRRPYEFRELREYYKGLIGLRKEIPGLCDKTKEAIHKIHSQKIEDKHCVSFFVDNRNAKNNCRWDSLFVVYHAGKEEKLLTLPEGEWEILVDDKASHYWQQGKTCEKAKRQLVIPPVSALILGTCERN